MNKLLFRINNRFAAKQRGKMKEYHTLEYLIIHGRNERSKKEYRKTFSSYEEAQDFKEYLLSVGVKNLEFLRKKVKTFSEVKTRFASKLIREARPLSFHSFIYALINKEEVVYIGQSSHLQNRIETHINEGLKEFDHWAIAHKFPPNTERKEIEKREQRYIKIFKPKYNITHNQKSSE